MPYHRELREYAPARRAVAGLDNLAQTIAVPKLHRPIRLPSFPNLERSAVLATEANATLGVAGATSVTAVVCRNPSVPVWVTKKPMADAAGSIYLAGAFNPVIPLSNQLTIDVPTDFYRAYSSVGSVNGLVGRPDQLPIGTYQDYQWFFFGNFTAYFEVSLSVSVGYNVNATFQFYDGATMTLQRQNQQATGSVITFAITDGTRGGMWGRLVGLDWVSNSASANVTTLAMGIKTGGSFDVPTGTNASYSLWPFGKAPEMDASPIPYQSARQTACGVLFSNVTAVLNKEGTITAARLPRSAVPPFSSSFANAPNFLSCHPKERYYGPLEKGLYTYTLSDAETVLFRDYIADSVLVLPTVAGTQARSAPLFYLDGQEYYNLILFSDIDATTSTTLGVSVDSHIEFRTSSALFQLGFAANTLETFHVAQMALARQGCFYENPLHLAAIGSLIKSAVMRLAPIVAPYAKQAAVAVGSHLLNAGYKKLGQMTQSNPGNPGNQSSVKRQKPRPKANKAKTIRRK